MTGLVSAPISAHYDNCTVIRMYLIHKIAVAYERLLAAKAKGTLNVFGLYLRSAKSSRSTTALPFSTRSTLDLSFMSSSHRSRLFQPNFGPS